MTLSTSAVAVCCCSDSEIVGALPQLVEQPRVLDRDDGLGGEVRDQFDLLVGERPHERRAIITNDADQLVSLSNGDAPSSDADAVAKLLELRRKVYSGSACTSVIWTVRALQSSARPPPCRVRD